MPPKGASGATTIGRSVGKGTKAGGAAAAGATGLLDKKASTTASKPRSTSLRDSPPAYSKEQLTEAEGRQELEPNDRRYDALWKEVQAKMGMPKNKPIHSEGMNRIDHILRVFDLNPDYGPCLGMTRLERWNRAEKLGDEPPEEIRHILQTKQGVLDYKFSVLHDKGV